MHNLKSFFPNPRRFDQFASIMATAVGRSSAFLLALALILLWAMAGPLFAYSEIWQLLINTGTTVITFLMVFLIQSTQNRDAKAVQIKLDELIRATKGAHTALLDLEELSEEELAVFKKKYAEIAARARQKMKEGDSDTNAPQVNLNDKIGEKNAKRH